MSGIASGIAVGRVERTMKVYLAARFSRRDELIGYAAELREFGVEVTSRWLFTDHEWGGADDSELPVEVGARFAAEDLDDILVADLVICFTEPARAGASRGGRHVEAGFALALGTPVAVVGPRENVFYCLPVLTWSPDWPSAKSLLFRERIQRQTLRRAGSVEAGGD